MNIYVSTYGSKIGVSNGKLSVSGNNALKEFPIETVDSVSIFPGVSITQPAIKMLSSKKADIFWLDSSGMTYAKVLPSGQGNIFRQKQQFLLMDDEEYILEMSKKFISAKIRNQLAVVRRLYRNSGELNCASVQALKTNIKKLDSVKSVSETEGIEGYSARVYFTLLGQLIPSEFRFKKRTKHPPRDCFSALLSYLYTLLYNDLVSAIQNAGLNPAIGIMHKLKENHYALASDIMEEFRAAVCDCTAVNLLKHTLTVEDFRFNEDGSVYLKTDSMKKAIAAYEKKLSEHTDYIKKQGNGTDYHSLFSIQVYELIESMNNENADYYHPIKVR